MASVWMKWAALAVFLVACVILVTAAPYDEEYMEPAADQQETSVDDMYTAEEAAQLRRIRRDSIGYAASGHGHHKGWGWYPPVGPVFTYVRTVVPVLLRIRRGDDHSHHGHGYGYIGPVYTYAKTDHYANFKWGVRHHVGGHHGHHG